MTRQHGRYALLLAALPLLLAACKSSAVGPSVATASGGSRATTPGAQSSAPAANQADRQLQFTQCLRDHGLDVADINPNDPSALGKALHDIPENKRTAAVNACQQYLGGSTEGPGGDKDAMFTYIDCLRQNGADVDDPDPNTGRPSQKTLDLLQNPDAAMKKAEAACVDKRPGANAGGG
jgi:hypothetical protein